MKLLLGLDYGMWPFLVKSWCLQSISIRNWLVLTWSCSRPTFFRMLQRENVNSERENGHTLWETLESWNISEIDNCSIDKLLSVN